MRASMRSLRVSATRTVSPCGRFCVVASGMGSRRSAARVDRWPAVRAAITLPDAVRNPARSAALSARCDELSEVAFTEPLACPSLASGKLCASLSTAGCCVAQREVVMSIATTSHVAVEGHVSAGFEAVCDAFTENFIHRRELGGACCVYRHGEKVVDLWSGIRNKQTGEPWERDTMVVVHSASKGLAAMTLAIAHSRGWLDYEERVAHYWPQFAQHGKETITIRQLLAHQAGLFAIDEPVDRSVVADLDRLAIVLARQKP